jgi:hypothetical protein
MSRIDTVLSEFARVTWQQWLMTIIGGIGLAGSRSWCRGTDAGSNPRSSRKMVPETISDPLALSSTMGVG